MTSIARKPLYNSSPYSPTVVTKAPFHGNVYTIPHNPNNNSNNTTRKRQANAGSFKPGNRVNPSGRPKMPVEFTQLMKDFSVEAAESILWWSTQRDDPKVSLAASMYIIDRAYGRPTQPNEISGPNGGPLQAPSLIVNFVDPNKSKTIDPDGNES